MLHIDCKSDKYVIEKDVENIASKHIFARWQVILSVFDFDIEYINGSQNTIPDFLAREDNHLAETFKQIFKKEPASSLEITNRFTTLGTIPRPNYSTVLASSYDPYAITLVNQPIRTAFSRNSYNPQYIKKQYFQNLFYIEPNRVSISDPLRLAKSYFLPTEKRIYTIILIF